MSYQESNTEIRLLPSPHFRRTLPPHAPPPARERLPLLCTVTNRQEVPQQPDRMCGRAAPSSPDIALISFGEGRWPPRFDDKALALRSPLCRHSSATQVRTHSVPHERPEDVTQEAREMKFLRCRALRGERGVFYKSQFNDQGLIQSLKRPKHLRWPVPAVGQAGITQLS